MLVSTKVILEYQFDLNHCKLHSLPVVAAPQQRPHVASVCEFKAVVLLQVLVRMAYCILLMTPSQMLI